MQQLSESALKTNVLSLTPVVLVDQCLLASKKTNPS